MPAPKQAMESATHSESLEVGMNFDSSLATSTVPSEVEDALHENMAGQTYQSQRTTHSSNQQRSQVCSTETDYSCIYEEESNHAVGHDDFIPDNANFTLSEVSGQEVRIVNVVKDHISNCSDIKALRRIQEIVRQRVNSVAKEGNRIRHLTTEVNKVGRYTYRKKQTKEGGPSYWYIHFTETDPATRRSRTVTRYLGKNPSFKPDVDLQKSRERNVI
jgi:hypothetical protein